MNAKKLAEWLNQGIDLSDLTHFLIIQPGDTAADAEHELGWSLFINATEDTTLGDPGVIRTIIAYSCDLQCGTFVYTA